MSPRNRRRVRKTSVTDEKLEALANMSPQDLKARALELAAKVRDDYRQQCAGKLVEPILVTEASEELSALCEQNPALHDFILDAAGFEKRDDGAWVRMKPPTPPRQGETT